MLHKWFFSFFKLIYLINISKISDIVLAIQRLMEKYAKILYIDIDIHHGNGVEDAFNYTSRVFKLSFHRYEEGFFPGSGAIEEIGKGKGKYHSLFFKNTFFNF